MAPVTADKYLVNLYVLTFLCISSHIWINASNVAIIYNQEEIVISCFFKLRSWTVVKYTSSLLDKI